MHTDPCGFPPLFPLTQGLVSPSTTLGPVLCPPALLRADGTCLPAHTPCAPPPRVLRAHGTRPPAHTPCAPHPPCAQMEHTRLHTHAAPLPPCRVTCGQNPRTVHPCQVQQLERGLPGRLKVVAKSTDGTETMEGIYNTVSICQASGGGQTLL